jgi:hypothetical protein
MRPDFHDKAATPGLLAAVTMIKTNARAWAQAARRPGGRHD